MTEKNLTQKVRGLFSGGEDRGVSPVIGVILMVAITVILAAVIGAFVLGLGGDLGNSTAPTAQLSANGDLTTDTDANDNEIYAVGGTDVTIEHTQGDSIAVDELRLVVREDGTNVGTIDGTALSQSGGTLNVGDTITLDDDVSNPSNNGLASILSGQTASEVTIDIVHSPSGSQLASGVVYQA